MGRWGKPTKNERRTDPRYFLNENTLERALRDSQKNDNPVIAISNNQFMQVRPVIAYDGGERIITGYAVDFGTRASKDGISGSGMMASADGPSPTPAIDMALQKIQQMSDQGKGPYGTDPVDLSASVRTL